LHNGAYVNLVMPPASPTTDSLLRCSVSAAHSDAQIDRIISAFAQLNPSTAQEANN
jgi:8-amino-7-oxononanoate synthase